LIDSSTGGGGLGSKQLQTQGPIDTDSETNDASPIGDIHVSRPKHAPRQKKL